MQFCERAKIRMKLLSIFFLFLSLGASLWLTIDVDPMRETCVRFRDEVVVSFVLNTLTFLLGGCCSWLCGRFVLVAVSALATVSLSRVSLFAYDVKTICAAGIASAPANDILTDVTVLDRVQFLSWAALIFFALGLLVAHLSPSLIDCFDFGDYFYHESGPRHYKKRRDCEEEETHLFKRKPSTISGHKQSTWIRIPI